MTQASATIAVTGYSVAYDGLAHTASGTATGALGEDLAGLLDLSATTHTAAGDYPADAWTFHDPDGNYADASGTVVDAITAGSLVITAADRTKPYGTLVTFAGTEFTVTGLQGADSVDSVTLARAGAPATAGVAGSPYPIEVSAAIGTGLANYTISYVPGALTVTPAGLTVTANDKTRPYGAPNPVLDATITGFVGGETLATSDVTGSPACTTTALATSPVAGSPYPVTCSAGTLASTNYTFAFVAGELTVTAGSLVITADDRTKPYGTLVTFAGTEFTVTGLQGADSVDSVTLVSAGAPATAGVAGSPYPIEVSAATGTRARQLHRHLRPGRADRDPGHPDHHRRRPVEGVRRRRSPSRAPSSA